MALAQTLMVFILIVSFGVLAAVFTFWISQGKLMQDADLKQTGTTTIMDTGNWETTTLMLR